MEDGSTHRNPTFSCRHRAPIFTSTAARKRASNNVHRTSERGNGAARVECSTELKLGIFEHQSGVHGADGPALRAHASCENAILHFQLCCMVCEHASTLSIACVDLAVHEGDSVKLNRESPVNA
eukprot:584249-Rhodomonas_salina.2